MLTVQVLKAKAYIVSSPDAPSVTILFTSTKAASPGLI